MQVYYGHKLRPISHKKNFKSKTPFLANKGGYVMNGMVCDFTMKRMGHILFSLLVSGCFETYWVEMLISSFEPDRTRDVYTSPAAKCWGIQFLWVRCLRRKSLFWDVIYFYDYIKKSIWYKCCIWNRMSIMKKIPLILKY